MTNRPPLPTKPREDPATSLSTAEILEGLESVAEALEVSDVCSADFVYAAAKRLEEQDTFAHEARVQLYAMIDQGEYSKAIDFLRRWEQDES